MLTEQVIHDMKSIIKDLLVNNSYGHHTIEEKEKYLNCYMALHDIDITKLRYVAKTSNAAYYLTREQEKEIQLIVSKETYPMIPAIKRFREITGAGLKDSKEIMETYFNCYMRYGNKS